MVRQSGLNGVHETAVSRPDEQPWQPMEAPATVVGAIYGMAGALGHSMRVVAFNVHTETGDRMLTVGVNAKTPKGKGRLTEALAHGPVTLTKPEKVGLLKPLPEHAPSRTFHNVCLEYHQTAETLATMSSHIDLVLFIPEGSYKHKDSRPTTTRVAKGPRR